MPLEAWSKLESKKSTLKGHNTEATQKPNADCNRKDSNVKCNAVKTFNWKNWHFLSSVHRQVLLYNT